MQQRFPSLSRFAHVAGFMSDGIPFRLIGVNGVCAVVMLVLTFGYPDNPIAVSVDLGHGLRFDVNALFAVIMVVTLSFMQFWVMRSDVFIVLLALCFELDQARAQRLVKAYTSWVPLVMAAVFFGQQVWHVSDEWSELSPMERFVGTVFGCYVAVYASFCVMQWTMVAHVAQIMVKDLSRSLEPMTFFESLAEIDREFGGSSVALVAPKVTLLPGGDATGPDSTAAKNPVTKREQAYAEVVTLPILQHYQAVGVAQLLFDLFAPLIAIKILTDVTMLLFGLSGTVNESRIMGSTFIVISISLVVVVVLLLPAALLTSALRDLSFHVARLRPFAKTTSQRLAIESLITYLMPFSRMDGGLRLYGLTITPAMVFRVSAIFYSATAAAYIARA